MEDRLGIAGFKFCIQYLGHHGSYRHDRRVAIRESAPIGPVGQRFSSRPVLSLSNPTFAEQPDG